MISSKAIFHLAFLALLKDVPIQKHTALSNGTWLVIHLVSLKKMRERRFINFYFSKDIFVYFSHYFITVPPPCWVHAAHIHGVPILGKRHYKKILYTLCPLFPMITFMQRNLHHWVGWWCPHVPESIPFQRYSWCNGKQVGNNISQYVATH